MVFFHHGLCVVSDANQNQIWIRVPSDQVHQYKHIVEYCIRLRSVQWYRQYSASYVYSRVQLVPHVASIPGIPKSNWFRLRPSEVIFHRKFTMKFFASVLLLVLAVVVTAADGKSHESVRNGMTWRFGVKCQWNASFCRPLSNSCASLSWSFILQINQSLAALPLN